MDRTTTVRASVHDIEVTLFISVIPVILVAFAFLRTFRHHHPQRCGPLVAGRNVWGDVCRTTA
jgi:hypothetical protein